MTLYLTPAEVEELTDKKTAPARPGLVTLEAWLSSTYNNANAPSILTARRWCRNGNIWPKPEKHGRAYYLHPNARYIDPANPPSDLKPSGLASTLLKKAALA